MKPKHGVGLLLLVCVLFLQSCSNEAGQLASTSNEEKKAEENADAVTTLRIMTGYDQQRQPVKDFEQYHGVKIEWVPTANGSIEEMLAAIDSDNPPDLIEFDYNHISDFIGYDTFEDLSQSVYSGADLAKRYFPGLDMAQFRSFDRSKLVIMPRMLHAAVMYYRPDLMKEYGFPDDPEALGNYLESPERWLSMAKKLAAKGKYVMQKPTDALRILDLTNGFLNNDGTFARNSNEFVAAMAIAKEAHRQNLALGATIWEASGQEAIRSGKLMMFLNGEWGDEHLEAWAPDTARLWETTRLPFNQYGIITGWVTAIPKQSRNKDAAWEYVKYQLERERSYLSTLQMSSWYDKLKPKRITPLDTAAGAVWEKEINWRYTSDMSSDRIISAIESMAMDQLADRLELMKSFNY